MAFLDRIFGVKLENSPVFNSHKDAPDDVWYRLKSDPPNHRIIKQSWPEWAVGKYDSMSKYVAALAGVTYREKVVKSFVLGSRQRISLKFEPQERYPHAIAVYGDWIDRKGKPQFNEHLGYVEDSFAKEIAEECKGRTDVAILGVIWAVYLPKPSLHPGMRMIINLLEPRKPRFVVSGYDRKSGRKRKKTFIATNLDEAIEKASTDGIIVDVNSVEVLHSIRVAE